LSDEEEIKDSVIGQFEKVQRSKTKFKCHMKDVIISFGGKDVILKRATAELIY